jgi:uracil phosphoribosyltransferase
MLDKVSLVSNPIIDQALMVIRNKKSDLESFRMALSQVVLVLIMEASKSFSQKETLIETPVEETKGKVLKNNIVIVATIRAGQL